MLSAALAETPPSGRVGQPVTLTDIYIPGGEAEPLPRRDRNPPLVVRLLDTKPALDGFRYDFEITGLDPGKYDLAKFLAAADPANPPEFPEIVLEIQAGLPAGIVLPHEMGKNELPPLGGYRQKMMTLAGLWLAGLIGILIWKRGKSVGSGLSEAAPPSLSQRLQPLVLQASTGDLDSSGRAALERLVIGHWRERLPEVASLPPAEAMAKLRAHPEAALLLLELERWLHSRDPNISTDRIEALLAPYR
jgi:hypothetical protein